MKPPIEHLDGSERVTVPGHLLNSRGGDHYVLRVVGDSMAGRGPDEEVVMPCSPDPGQWAVLIVLVLAIMIWWPRRGR